MLCDDLGFKDTFSIQIMVTPPPGTIPVITPMDSTVTVCLDTMMLPGTLTGAVFCGEAVNGITGTYVEAPAVSITRPTPRS